MTERVKKEQFEQRPKILVVEDEQIVALDVRAQLLDFGYEVVGIVANGKDALILTERKSPDLVLMDIKLRGRLDGIATADEIRRQWQIPVVFMTAFGGEEMVKRANSSAPYGYLTKPFRSNDLNATVMIALQQHSSTTKIFQEHSWLRTVLAGMSDGIIATDTEGRVRFVNKAAEDITGWMLDEALEQRIELVCPLFQMNGEPAKDSRLRRALDTNKAIGRERYVLKAKKQHLIIEASVAPIHDPQRRMAGAVTVLVDVTERNRAEQESERLRGELLRSNEDLTGLSYAVAHDLRGPTNNIHALGELLKSGKVGELNKEQLRLTGMITDTAFHMQQMITAMLDFAQVGHGEIKRESVVVNEIVDAVRTSLAAAIADSGAEVYCQDLPVIEADRTQVEQVFQNLVSNAVKYRNAGEAPKISILGETVAEGWEFAVADNGEGVPAESLQLIFKPLKRLHGRDVPGAGLGLALCQRIIERHGGRIWAESAGIGKGTTFRFFIPRSASS